MNSTMMRTALALTAICLADMGEEKRPNRELSRDPLPAARSPLARERCPLY